MAAEEPARPLSGREQTDAIKTWRYLRIAMVGLAAGLLVAIAYEFWKVEPDCLQTSISAYYYTPARGYFVGGLVAIGVCLFCLKGSSEAEDILLNVAGMLALIVALVPTPGTGECASFLGTTDDRDVNIANNVTTLLVIGLVALVVLVVLARRNPPTPVEILAFAVAAAVLAATAITFWTARPTFVRWAHYTAAVLMFVCILAVVWINALGYRNERGGRPTHNPYIVVAVLMGASCVIVGAAAWRGWEYWVIAIEAALLVLFAMFWITQTIELWNRGLRPSEYVAGTPPPT